MIFKLLVLEPLLLGNFENHLLLNLTHYCAFGFLLLNKPALKVLVGLLLFDHDF